ncbi:pyroglutamyl-peptidase I [Hydrogenophaga sp. ANAO-22]|jgi:pyroglutamyl-peptidase|uniref:pyroglutamyl-peptidase I n=1 Tax=Hydrogenophaga sp. ANAO-22 TaxID=3166645 RepID=UPI0036D30C5A
MQKKVLLTGFDAFGGQSLNPSWLAVQALHGRKVLGHTVVAAQLPTVFDASLCELDALLRQHQPALVICVGQAGGRKVLSLERVAINVNDAPLADNAGARPVDTPVVRDAPVAYFTGLPIKAMLAALHEEGVGAEVSQTAGTFVCNHVFYGLMRTLSTVPELAHTRGGFVHVPWLPEQGVPNMALDDIVRGLRVAVRSALQVDKDHSLGAGATH